MKIPIDLSPITQKIFDEDALRGFAVKRHQLRTTWQEVIHPPATAGKDMRVRVPFKETYLAAFESMVDWPIRTYVGSDGVLTIYLQETASTGEAPECVQRWIEIAGKYVVMRDFLALSCALDFEREGGDPDRLQTQVGELRAQAKPYGAQGATSQTKKAADKLVKRYMAFLKEMTCYESADCVVAMPPSDPSKEYNLPRYLAEKIAEEWGRPDLSKHVRTIKKRRSLKSAAVAEKLETLMGTIEVDKDVFHKKKVLLIDDLYQSGTSINYCALMLLRAGASKVFGLACEKTCRNDDNVGGR